MTTPGTPAERDPGLDALSIAQNISKTNMDRRGALKLGLGGALAIAGVIVGERLLTETTGRSHVRDTSLAESLDFEAYTQELFESAGLGKWDTLTVITPLLQIDRGARVSTGMFEPARFNIACPEGGSIVASSPIAVKPSIRRYAEHYDSTKVEKALEGIADGLIAFYTPNLSHLVYMDADANDGLILPLTGNAFYGRHLELSATPKDVNGHHTAHGLPLPYYTEKGGSYPVGSNFYYSDYTSKEIEIPIARSITVTSDFELNNLTFDSTYNYEAPLEQVEN